MLDDTSPLRAHPSRIPRSPLVPRLALRTMFFSAIVMIAAMVFGRSGSSARESPRAAAADVGPLTSPRSDARPALRLTLAVILAGGGKQFHSTRLFSRLAGDNRSSEAELLNKRFGSPRLDRFFAFSDFVFHDAMHVFNARAITKPDAAYPDPSNGRALAVALYRAGTSSVDASFDPDLLLDRLLTPAVHRQVVEHAKPRFAPGAYGEYCELMRAAMENFRAQYER
jgi:hypothetical protein